MKIIVKSQGRNTADDYFKEIGRQTLHFLDSLGFSSYAVGVELSFEPVLTLATDKVMIYYTPTVEEKKLALLGAVIRSIERQSRKFTLVPLKP